MKKLLISAALLSAGIAHAQLTTNASIYHSPVLEDWTELDAASSTIPGGLSVSFDSLHASVYNDPVAGLISHELNVDTVGIEGYSTNYSVGTEAGFFDSIILSHSTPTARLELTLEYSFFKEAQFNWDYLHSGRYISFNFGSWLTLARHEENGIILGLEYTSGEQYILDGVRTGHHENVFGDSAAWQFTESTSDDNTLSFRAIIEVPTHTALELSLTSGVSGNCSEIDCLLSFQSLTPMRLSLTALDGTLSSVNGYLAAPVPEPGTYAMMLAGLGVIGAVARRRKRAA